MSDGKSLIYFRAMPDTGAWRVPATAGAAPELILPNAREASVSGDLVAFASDSTGRSEVYVTRLGTDVITPVSTNGGRHPRWTSSGEVFFPCGPPTGDTPQANRALCVASIDRATGARRGPPTLLFNAEALGYVLVTYGERGYDVHRNGSRILVQTSGLEGTPAISLIENAGSFLRRGPR